MHPGKYKHAWYWFIIREIAVEMSEMWESKQTFAQKNQAGVTSVTVLPPRHYDYCNRLNIFTIAFIKDFFQKLKNLCFYWERTIRTGCFQPYTMARFQPYTMARMVGNIIYMLYLYHSVHRIPWWKNNIGWRPSVMKVEYANKSSREPVTVNYSILVTKIVVSPVSLDEKQFPDSSNYSYIKTTHGPAYTPVPSI